MLLDYFSINAFQEAGQNNALEKLMYTYWFYISSIIDVYSSIPILDKPRVQDFYSSDQLNCFKTWLYSREAIERTIGLENSGKVEESGSSRTLCARPNHSPDPKDEDKKINKSE